MILQQVGEGPKRWKFIGECYVSRNNGGKLAEQVLGHENIIV